MSNCPSSDASYEGLTCTNNTVSGQNILSAIVIDAILGFLCYIGFVLWRGFFPVYRGREILPGVRHRPPKLSLKSHNRYWNWILPAFKISDSEFLKSAGLDALVAVRILSYGLALFIPVGLLGIAILLPVNYTSTGLVDDGQAPEGVTNSNLTYLFLRMTISNIPNGSSLMWIHFVFLLFAVAYGCLLIILYYEENISLQHTLFKNYVDDMKKGVGFDVDSSAPVEGDGDANTLHLDRLLGDSGIELDDQVITELERVGENLETGTVNARVVKMMDLENKSLLAQAFRQTVEKPEPGKLWPVPRPRRFTPSRPQFAGRYAVLVIDEPRKQYRKSATVSLMRRRDKSENKSSRRGFFSALFGLFKSSRSSSSLDDQSSSEKMEELQEIHVEGDIETKHSSVDMYGYLPENDLTNRKPKTSCCGLVKQSDESYKNEMNDRFERFRFIETTFKRLFQDDFDCLVPVYNTEEIDAVMLRRYNMQAKIERIKLQIKQMEYSDVKNKEKKEKKLTRLNTKLDSLLERDAALGTLICDMKKEIFSNPACPSFIAIFHSAMSAQTASCLNANPLSWRGFHTMPAPDPENINFPALTTTCQSRNIRTPVALVFIVFVMLFPLGIFTGAFSQLETAICGAPAGSTASASDSWICSDDFWAKLIMGVITGLLPQLLLTIYQSVFLPIYVMFCSQAERKHFSLSKLDLRCAQLFFHWNVWNFFFGTLLGGTIISGIRQAISDPGAIVNILGTAIPQASNFFINYVILRALTMTMFRLFYPHACVGMNIAQWFFVMPSTLLFQENLVLQTLSIDSFDHHCRAKDTNGLCTISSPQKLSIL